MPRNIAVVQARQNSTRLSNKVLADINGKPMIRWIVDEARKSSVSSVVVATMADNYDLIEYCTTNGIDLFPYEGQEDDLLGRINAVTELWCCDNVVRIWGDCPMINFIHIDSSIWLQEYTKNDYLFDYAVKGTAVAVITTALLARLNRELTELNDRENFHTVILNNPTKYNALILGTPYTDGCTNYSVDTAEDLYRIRKCLK
jgi:spore coat polysaccharide biosynthesis protein SpsF